LSQPIATFSTVNVHIFLDNGVFYVAINVVEKIWGYGFSFLSLALLVEGVHLQTKKVVEEATLKITKGEFLLVHNLFLT